MKIRLVAVVAAALVVLPGLATADAVGRPDPRIRQQLAMNAHPAECARLNRQIDHFTGMYQRANAAGNQMWQDRMTIHLDRLLSIQMQRCPNDVAVDNTSKAFKAMLKLAARAAIAYFTFGAAGF